MMQDLEVAVAGGGAGNNGETAGHDALTAVLEARGLKGNGSLSALRDRVEELCWRLEASQEMQSLLHGFSGGFIEPGPSGLITKGKIEVLPTGRNFFSLDPAAVPTDAAWMVGRKLADSLIEKYQKEQGRIPENVAMFWMAGDVMYADGEQMAQMFYLIGVQPVWKGGRLNAVGISTPASRSGTSRTSRTCRPGLRRCMRSKKGTTKPPSSPTSSRPLSSRHRPSRDHGPARHRIRLPAARE